MIEDIKPLEKQFYKIVNDHIIKNQQKISGDVYPKELDEDKGDDTAANGNPKFHFKKKTGDFVEYMKIKTQKIEEKSINDLLDLVLENIIYV